MADAREIGVIWSSTQGCGAQLSRQWFATYLSHILESALLHPSGSLDKYLGTPNGKWGLSPEATCGWSLSADMDVLITCADILLVSPFQMCLA